MDLLTELAILVLAALRRLRGHLEGAEHAAHAADVGDERDPRDRPARRRSSCIGPADGFLNELLLVIAIAFGTINVVGGFLVTDRMLGMFKGRKPDREATRRRGVSRARLASTCLYIVGFALFIFGLHMVARPAHGGARQPDRRRRHGDRAGRDAARRRGSATGCLIVVGVAIGTRVGVPAARSVKMTAMPQMVALFNGVGGGAVALISLGRVPRGATTSRSRR